jgi:large subunit ribosomal protein L21
MTSSEVKYAVIRVGGRQFKVSEGDTILVDRVAAEPGAKLHFAPLAVRTAEPVADPAALKRARVTATVRDHVLGEKVRVFKYKPKTTYKRARGHRSQLSRLTIDAITLKGGSKEQ